MEKHRRQFFVAEKTMERSKKQAWAELLRSLKRLKVSNFDLYQLHAIGDLRQLNTALRKDGAIWAIRDAKETGLVKHIGITGHKDMRVLMKAMMRFDFDSVMLPVNLASMSNLKPENDFRPVLREATERDMSVTAIKAIAKGRWSPERRKQYRTWYAPLDRERPVLEAVRFTLSQRPVASYSLPCDTRLWSLVMRAGLNFKRLSENEQTRAVEHARENRFRALFPTRRGEFSPA
jgi:predicted aldo/keto reductase-like oxidoreductase